MSNRLLATPRFAVGNRAPLWPYRRARNWQADGLQFWWPGAPVGYDTAYDLGPHRYSLLVGTLLRDDWIATEFGGWAIDFAGTSDWVETNDFSWSGGPITICFWTKIAGATEASAFGFDATLGDERVQAHVPWSDGVIYWDYGDTTNGRVSWDMSGQIGEWVHVALVAEGAGGSYQAIYVNGIERASAGNGDEASGTKLEIGHGGFSGADYYHNGAIFDFRVYDRVLSAAEVRALFDPQTRWNLYGESTPQGLAFPATSGATPETVTESLDAALARIQARQAALDAAARRARTDNAEIDAAIQGLAAALAQLDATLRAGRTAALGLDAHLQDQGVGTLVTSLDGAVRALVLAAASVDAALGRAETLGAQMDARLASLVARIVQLGAVVRRMLSRSVALEAALRGTPDVAAGIDAVIGAVTAAGRSRTFVVPARGGHAVAGDVRTLVIPGGNRRH